eukprot:9219932-Alexandrium_andersonii.AAC.1
MSDPAGCSNTHKACKGETMRSNTASFDTMPFAICVFGPMPNGQNSHLKLVPRLSHTQLEHTGAASKKPPARRLRQRATANAKPLAEVKS